MRALGGTASHKKKIDKQGMADLGLSPPHSDKLWHNLFLTRMGHKKYGLVESLGEGEWSLTARGREIDIGPIEKVSPNLSQTLTIHLSSGQLDELRHQAEKKGIEATTLARMWVVEHLQSE